MDEWIITKISIQKRDKKRYNIFINGDYQFSVHEDVLVRHELRKGMNVSETMIVELRDEEERHRAFLDAVNLLSFRPRTRKELERKLVQKEYSTEIIQPVLEQLMNRNLINDREFAKQWVEERSSNKGKGRLILRQELIEKGVDKIHIDEALSEINEHDEYETALTLAKKRLEKFHDSEWVEVYRKVGSYLVRRGFGSGMVSQVMSELKQEWTRHREGDTFS